VRGCIGAISLNYGRRIPIFHGRLRVPLALYITAGTAKTHVARLLAKLDARDRVQLVITAYETGLVTAPH
jgi:hypothetical protein